MDIASLIGLIGAFGMVIGAMSTAGGLGPFIDVASILIVAGGSFFAVMLKSKGRRSLTNSFQKACKCSWMAPMKPSSSINSTKRSKA